MTNNRTDAEGNEYDDHGLLCYCGRCGWCAEDTPELLEKLKAERKRVLHALITWICQTHFSECDLLEKIEELQGEP